MTGIRMRIVKPSSDYGSVRGHALRLCLRGYVVGCSEHDIHRYGDGYSGRNGRLMPGPGPGTKTKAIPVRGADWIGVG